MTETNQLDRAHAFVMARVRQSFVVLYERLKSPLSGWNLQVIFRHPTAEPKSIYAMVSKVITEGVKTGGISDPVLQNEAEAMVDHLTELMLDDIGSMHRMRRSFIQRLKFLFKPQ